MANQNAIHDDNRFPTILAVSSENPKETVALKANPETGALIMENPVPFVGTIDGGVSNSTYTDFIDGGVSDSSYGNTVNGGDSKNMYL